MTLESGDKLVFSSAVDIAEGIRIKQVSAREVVDAFLERIDKANRQVNAIVTLTADEARDAADKADRAVASGQSLGPLHGVPFSVKDIIATAGVRTTAGSKLLSDWVPGSSAPAIQRLQASGSILLGKSNCPEFALDMHTNNLLFGPTFNPWNLDYTSGGSSGGDSAAVAGGLVGFGIGTDYGGSIRWPAHCTGLVSMRPTPGLVPSTGQIPYSSSGRLPPPNSMSLQSQLQTIAPIARSVNDLWAAVNVMAGPDGLDLHAVPVPLGEPSQVEVTDLRCAWFDSEGTYPIRDDLIAAVVDAADALADAGLRVVNRRPPGMEAVESVFKKFRAADGLPDHRSLATGHLELLTDNMRSWFANETSASVGEYRTLAAQRDNLRAGVIEFMREWPILLLPVSCLPAFVPDPPSFVVDGVEIPRINIITACRVISALRLPALVVPVGTSKEGMPIGVQVVGRPFADHEVVAVGLALERTFGRWRPPLGPVRRSVNPLPAAN